MDIEKLEEFFHSKQRTKNDQLFIYDQLQQIKFFKDYASRGKVEEINQIIQKGKIRKYQKDSCIIEIDIKSEYFYVILSGQVGFYIPKPKKGKEEAKAGRQLSKVEKQRDQLFLVKAFKKGESFGEISIIYDRGSDGSMYCLEETHCLLLSKKDFIEIIGDSERNSIAKEVEFLQQHPLFENWSFNLLRLLYFFSQIVTYNKNEVVYLQDTKPSHIYIIKKGEFAIYRNFKEQNKKLEKKNQMGGDEGEDEEDEENEEKPESNEPQDNLKMKFEKSKKYKLAVMGVGEIFGEEDILMKQNRSFSVVCDSYNGAQLIMIKRKVFKLSIMADIGSSTFIKQRLKQKNYNHQLRMESINTFLKEYKEYVGDGSNSNNSNNNERKQVQNEQVSLNNPAPSSQIIQLRHDYSSYKRNSSDSQNIQTPQNVYQGYLSPPSQFSQERSGQNLNFSSYQNERKKSFNQQLQSQHESVEIQKEHQDLLDHFSQFEKKIYKNEKNKISSNNNKGSNSPLLEPVPLNKNSSYQIKFPNQNQNHLKLTLSQDNSPEYNMSHNNQNIPNSGRGDSQFKISMNNLVSPINLDKNQQADSFGGIIAGAQSQATRNQLQPTSSQFNTIQLPSNSQLQKSSHESLNSSYSNKGKQVLSRKQKSVSTQSLQMPSEVSHLLQQQALNNFYSSQDQFGANLLKGRAPSPQLLMKSTPQTEYYHQVDGNSQGKPQLSNQKRSSSHSQTQKNEQKPLQEDEKNPEENYFDFKKQSSQQQMKKQLQNFNQPSHHQFYNLYNSDLKDETKMANQDILFNFENSSSDQGYSPNLIKCTNSIINPPSAKKGEHVLSKFVMEDNSTFSPNKYPINLTHYEGQKRELSQFQQAQQFQFNNSFNPEQKKNAKKLHLQFLLNKQKPKSAKGICSSISATMPFMSSQTCAQICTFPKENLEFNYSMNINNNFPYSSQRGSLLYSAVNNSTSNYPTEDQQGQTIQNTQKLQQQQQQQQQPQQLQTEAAQRSAAVNEDQEFINEQTEPDRQKQKKKTFRNSIFTDTFQKTFQQNLHQIQFKILKKQHKVSEIQQSIAKHIQDSTIKHFLEENTLVKSKYDHLRQKKKTIEAAKSEPQLVALKQMLKNNLHYSNQEIENGLTQKSQRPTNTHHRKLVPSEVQTTVYEDENNAFQQQQQYQQNHESAKISPSQKQFFDRPRGSLQSAYPANSQRSQYKFQQQKDHQKKQSLVLDVQRNDDLQFKNFSITPNDKTGTVYVKSLQSITSLPQSNSENHFSFQKFANYQDQNIKKLSMNDQNLKQTNNFRINQVRGTTSKYTHRKSALAKPN